MMLPLLCKRSFNPRIIAQQIRGVSVTAPVNAGYWNKDWRPADDPPKTEEGRRAAAKKYGLIPEDYETYVNDGTGYGDYPKLPLISAEQRDPGALYDFPELKRNYGEPMHVEFDMVGEDRWNYGQRLRIPLWKQWCWFLGVMGGTGLLFCLGQYVRVTCLRMMPRHMVNDGRKHYSFEMEDVE